MLAAANPPTNATFVRTPRSYPTNSKEASVNPSLAMFLSFCVVGVFSFISVAAWAGSRAEERKAFYRSETLKKLAESGSAAVLEYLREEERQADRRRAEHQMRVIEGHRLTGLILTAVGSVITIGLWKIVPEPPVYILGMAPLAIGVVFLGLSLFPRRAA
jgi:hypothetical protein